MYLLLAGCLVVLGLMLIKCQKRDSFKPNRQEQEHRADELLKNATHIRDGLSSAKKVMSWIDPITYEDARQLLRKNKYTKSDIMQILN